MRILTIAILIALAGTASAQTVDDIVAKNVAARGGAKLASIRSIRFTGKQLFGDFEIAWGEVIARGNSMRTELTVQGMTAVFAYDGREGWSVSPFQGRLEPERASADDARGFAQQAELDGPLVDYKAKGHRIEYLGSEDVDGTPAWKLRVTRADGDVDYVYIDPDSALEIRRTSVHKVRGAEQITETDLGNYEQVDGVWFPFAMDSGAVGEPKRAHLVIERAEANVAVDDHWFHVPTTRVARVIAPGNDKPPPPAAVPPAATSAIAFDSGMVSGLGARNLGSAAMSGRVSAVAGIVQGGKTTIYVGAASGGVWRSYDGGTTFKPIFDRQPVQSIGAITIDPSNPKIIWVGTGEAWTRNSTSFGDGIYRSTDGGETWTNMGLADAERIVRIAVHPKDSNTVFACVPGRLWSDSKDRGLYRTIDGGKTWSLVLAGANQSTGCSSVAIDPSNPKQMLAGMWDFRRKGWTFRSGGETPDAPSGSGMFRSVDGGRTWAPTSTAKGLPPAPWGRVEISYAPSNGKIAYALVESKDSALYRSADGGATWEARDKSQMMVWRPFYFARLVVDPTNPDRLFKPDLQLVVSEDGGRSFASAGGTHGDWHDVWIDPTNPRHMFGGDDGGFWQSVDGGSKWIKQDNLPISQFYHVAVDGKDPYQVYGGLQDNGSWYADSAYPGGVSTKHWHNLCGGDGFWTIPDPSDPEAVYCEAQGGTIERIDRKTMTARDIQPRARYHEKLRYNWNMPIAVSPTQRGTLYLGAQFLFRSRDRGDTWQRISPDLTSNDPQKQKQEQSGGVTIDNSAAEMHTTIYSISESPRNASVVWVGTDDGNVQLTRDAGQSWTNVVGNITGLPASSWVSWVEASRFDPATAYAAFDRHTFGDFAPWVYVTRDWGKTWKRIVAPDQGVRGYAHVIKEDAIKPNLLFVGTELGLWISLDGGGKWAKFEGGNFPSVAVRDLQIQPRDNDLAIATHGRGIWIIDDITPLRALSADLLGKSTAFLATRPVQQRLLAQAGGDEVLGDASFVAENPPAGLPITYYLRSRHVFGPIKLEVLDDKGRVIDAPTPSKHRGINRVVWAMRVKPPRVPRAAQVAGSSTQGPRVVPGSYTIRLTRGADVVENKVVIGLDRRATFTAADRQAQFTAAMNVQALFEDMSKLVDGVEAMRAAVADRIKAVPAQDPLAGKLHALATKLDDQRKLIVATTEGGAITGEERLREHADSLYSALLAWEGKPAPYLIERLDVLRRELTDVAKDFDGSGKTAHALDDELKQHKLLPIPVASAAAPPPAELDARIERCIESQGGDCPAQDAAIATERD